LGLEKGWIYAKVRSGELPKIPLPGKYVRFRLDTIERRVIPPLTSAYLNPGPPSGRGGEWLWSREAPVCSIVPRAPGLIWVHGLVAGDVMVDGSIRVERLRPLGLCWSAALGRESRKLRELAGSVVAIWEVWAWRTRSASEGLWFR
jgi:hypothetical protein